MPAPIDLTGRVFGRLTVLRFVESRRSRDGYRRRIYLVRCECGVEKELMGIALTSGQSVSCGCYRAEYLRVGSITHGHTKGGWTPEYKTWQSMLRRCLTPGAAGYVKYGAKGVRVCQEWQDSFEAFLAHIGPRPSSEHSIDRIDTRGHYEPGNVRWATRLEQARNKTSNRLVTVDGVSLPVSVWAERQGIPAARIISRLNRGWSDFDAVMGPLQRPGVDERINMLIDGVPRWPSCPDREEIPS